MTVSGQERSDPLNVAAHQRTPPVAVAYARLLGVPPDRAQADVRATLPDLRGHGRLWEHATLVRSAT